MNINKLTLEQQIDFLTENSAQLPPIALLCFASKLGEMSEAGEKLYIATLKDGQDNIATIDIGKPVWFVFTDTEKFNQLPDGMKDQLDLNQRGLQEILDLFMKNSSADGIAFNPFSNRKGIFFANKQVITLAW